MRLVSLTALLGTGLGCYVGKVSGPQVDDVIVDACVWSTSSETPVVEVRFDTTFNPGCHISPEAACEVALNGDTLVVTGEASYRETSRFCDSANYTMGASCTLPAGWESATALDWGTGASEPVEPPIVGLGQGANAGCTMPCRVGEGGTLCD